MSLLLAGVYLVGGIAVASHYGYAERDHAGGPRLVCALPGRSRCFIFGSIFITIGAACTDLKDAQGMMTPAMLLLMLPWLTWFSVAQAPDSTMSLALSLFPTATPFLMLMRIAIPPGPPMWQIALSVVLTGGDRGRLRLRRRQDLPYRAADAGQGGDVRRDVALGEGGLMAPSFQRDSADSPRFAQPATFMRLPHVDDPHGLDVAIVGVPYDGGTSYRSGRAARAARDPGAVVADPSVQLLPEGRAVRSAERRRRRRHRRAAGRASRSATRRSKRAIGAIADAGARPIVIGGDHSISLPILRALAKRHGPLALVQFDAHIDTWDEYFGGKYFHGTPFRRAIEEGLIDGRRVHPGRHPRTDVRRGRTSTSIASTASR